MKVYMSIYLMITKMLVNIEDNLITIGCHTANTFMSVRKVKVTATGLMADWIILSFIGSSGASGFGSTLIGSKSKVVK